MKIDFVNDQEIRNKKVTFFLLNLYNERPYMLGIMVIASILPRTKKDLLNTQDIYPFPDYLEVRFDQMNIGEAIETLKDLPGKKIAACRREQDGGFFKGREETRISILEKAVLSGLFDYVDIEMESGSIALLRKYQDTKFIVSHHDIRHTPHDIDSIYGKLISITGASLYKLVTYANTLSDTLRIKRILKKARDNNVPLIGFCMGETGSISRILCLSWGSRGTYASFKRGKETAAGQISYAELFQSFDIMRITPSTRIFGVLGYPIGHSLSPIVHNAAYRHEEIDYACIPFEIPSPGELFGMCDQFAISGFAVTSPFKEAVINFLLSVSREAQEIGSVNTIIVRDAHMMAFNTDWRAFISDLKESIPDVGHERFAIIGDGGAARSVAYALKRENADVRIFSRNRSKGEKIARHFQSSWHPLEELGNFEYSIIVNCTTAGMYPEIDSSPVREEVLKGKLAYDLIYNPPVTRLMEMALGKGIRARNGKGMFLKQAALQFRLLAGREAPAEIMEEAFEQGIRFLDKG